MNSIKKNDKKRAAIAIATLFCALGFTGWRMQSAFGGNGGAQASPADAPVSVNITDPTQEQGDAPASKVEMRLDTLETEKTNAAELLTRAHFTNDNPFEMLAQVRHEAQQQKLAAERAKKAIESMVTPPAAPVAPEIPDRSLPITPLPEIPRNIEIRGLIEAGPKSTVLIGSVLLNIGDTTPDGLAVLEEVAGGKAWFRRGGERVAAVLVMNK